jgi:hypothetical protein
MKGAESGMCGQAATHEWGKVRFCCRHFDGLIIALYDLNEAVSERRHTDLVEIYEENMKRTSRLTDVLCQVDKPKPEKPPSD